MPDTNYEAWKLRPVSELATRPLPLLTPQESERYTIYSLALMALTLRYWNGNKYGRNKLYPLNEAFEPVTNKRADGDYLGHNISAFAVDRDGLIIDFAFNHNEVYNSSVEHAEARLLKRIFSLSQIHDSWDTGRELSAKPYSTLMKEVTVYTTLESCAQCSGMMALGQLKSVVFLQDDPGQYQVGNIMRNMTEGTPSPSPEPIPASAFGLPHFQRLSMAYQKTRVRPKVKENAIVLASDGTELRDSYSGSITSFLCTKAARDIFKDGADEFSSYKVAYPDWKPDAADAAQLTNAGVLKEAIAFVSYADSVARRGTSHKI